MNKNYLRGYYQGYINKKAEIKSPVNTALGKAIWKADPLKNLVDPNVWNPRLEQAAKWTKDKVANNIIKPVKDRWNNAQDVSHNKNMAAIRELPDPKHSPAINMLMGNSTQDTKTRKRWYKNPSSSYYDIADSVLELKKRLKNEGWKDGWPDYQKRLDVINGWAEQNPDFKEKLNKQLQFINSYNTVRADAADKAWQEQYPDVKRLDPIVEMKKDKKNPISGYGKGFAASSVYDRVKSHSDAQAADKAWQEYQSRHHDTSGLLEFLKPGTPDPSKIKIDNPYR